MERLPITNLMGFTISYINSLPNGYYRIFFTTGEHIDVHMDYIFDSQGMGFVDDTQQIQGLKANYVSG